ALAVGCALDIPEYVRNAVESPFSIRAMLANNIDRDGRYYESSLGYAIHARGLYLTFADPLFNLRSEEYPEGLNLYDDPKMQSALLLPDLQVELAGRRPNFGDSAPDFAYKPMTDHPFSSVDYGYLERLYAMTSNPERKKEYGQALQYLADGDIDSKRAAEKSDWLLWHAEEPPVVEGGLPDYLESRVHRSWVAGMKGMALLRSGDQAAFLRYGPSLTHGDPDDLALLYYANGYELSYDIGYGLGSTHVHCGWASSTVSHCLVTVDENNQLGAEGSGGSLIAFADLPSVQMVDAESAPSYTGEGVEEYRRTVALMSEGGYLIDVFRVRGGTQHDFGFGSIGTELEPYGVPDLKDQEGSLTEGVNWADKIGKDGDIIGYPNKPYWKPPPGNGYGFFFDVRSGSPEVDWGGTWSIDGKIPTQFRMHILGEADEAIYASAPGLYPSKPLSSYVMARRTAKVAPLESVFMAVYEPFVRYASGEVQPVIEKTRRLGPGAIEVIRKDGKTDVVLTEKCTVKTSFGNVKFEGDFALLTGEGDRLVRAESLGCNRLEVNGKSIFSGTGVLTAKVVEVDPVACRVRLDHPVEGDLENLIAIFSNPDYSRTTAYHIANVSGEVLELQANSLVLGEGRVQSIEGNTLISDVPHEYARSVPRKDSTLFFDGKRLAGPSGKATKILSTDQGDTLRIEVEDASDFEVGDSIEYVDLSVGDQVRIALPQVLRFPQEKTSKTPKKPNIVLITADNLGYGDVGCYGNDQLKTPTIDRLAEQGVRLTDFYTASPTCTVSRACLLTGRYPQRHGLNIQLPGIEGNYGEGLSQSETLLPELLKPLGYATGCFGKWNIGFAPGSRPTERGFDEFFGHASGNIDYYTHVYNLKPDLHRGTETVEVEGYSTDLFADEAIDFIKRHQDQPFFVYLPFNAPHFPNPKNKRPGEPCIWQAPEKAFEAYG
ncbi:MAG: sulfatase-like hydrolase/transferase, partial [Candidatus Omnitrophica bacterium]|nr:sulfatase-like hydrolase/transferase [Candidatus Omnitrophota bacterium]